MPFRQCLSCLFMVLLFLLMQGPVAFATIWHVEEDGTGDLPTIQDAINAASNDDIVELGNGTFRGTGNRDINLLGKVIVVRSASDNPDLCTLDIEGQLNDNHRGFLLANQEGPGTGFRGFTIRNGFMLGDSASVERGGALYLGVGGGASPFFENMRFEQNTASDGGAVYVHIGSVVRFDDCEFVGNQTFDNIINGEGGALYLREAVCTLTRCRFMQNVSESSGGAVEASGTVTMLDCEFLGNTVWGFDRDGGAVRSGAIAVISGCSFRNNSVIHGSGGAMMASHLEMVDSEFVENTTSLFGGAIYLHSEPPIPRTIDRCTFVNNAAGVGGGAIYVRDQDISIRGCHFQGNSVQRNSGSDGGAIRVRFCHAEIFESTLVENVGDYGGAVSSSGSLASVAMGGCTLKGNLAIQGGGVFFSGSGEGSSILRTIFAFNKGGGAIGGSQDPPTVACSDIYGNRGGDSLFGIDKGGNFSADPLFCGAAIGNLTISAESPCAPENSGECGLIGAQPVACGAVSLEPKSWGQIKGMYR